ncbi:MAG: aminotransferase class III-fold pyridoxal phosphate-dependent enzyme, partial [Chloroflexi bacterium]|nr:aminotransferase class III-fold pyridoxal phosphate-dependent enzyme [Chloroflexota bacterium]
MGGPKSMATTLSGERIEELKQQAADHFWPHNNPAGNMDDDGIKLVQSGKGVWVEDVEGEQWFDTMAGMWLKNIGHGRKEVADAVYNQMLDISYSPRGTVSP